MAKFVLGEIPTKILEVVIGEETIPVPLAGSLTPEELVPLNTEAGTQEFFKKHIAAVSEELADSLTVDQYNAITAAWVKESNESKKNVGE